MRLAQIPANDFDLARTLDSGQVFHWQQHGNGYAGTIDGTAVYVEQRRNRLLFTGATSSMIQAYFSLDHPLRKICRSFPDDPVMRTAREYCPGLRIIRQPKWECLATFITSSMKQVAHIRQISQALRKRFGKQLTICGFRVHTFPFPQRIAHRTEKELCECALGYRAKYLLATAQLVSSGTVNLERWGQLSDESLRNSLCQLPGVGAKVANCVMLFAYERLRAFPIHVWMERVLRQEYFPKKRKMTTRERRAFCDAYFGPYGGYAQQYLFHHARRGGVSGEGRTK